MVGMRFVVSGLLFAGLLGAAEMLLPVSGLEALKANPKLVLLHVGMKADYDAGHIPGARLVTMAELANTGKLRLEMPDEADLKARLMKLGITNGVPVVVYAGNESIQSATRVWFTLAYAGLEPSLLNGGLAAWKAKGLGTETAAASFAPASDLTLKLHKDWIVDAEWVNGHLKDPKVAIVDARLPEFYSGQQANGMPRAGHLPGAKNVPFSSLVTAEKALLPKAELAGKIGDGKTVVTYCHIGMQATVAFFAAKLTGQDAKLYDGSFEDWSARKELPIE